VCLRGCAPVDQIGVEAGFHVVCHDTPAFLEIHDVRPVHQSEHETKGRLESGFALSDTVVNFEPVLQPAEFLFPHFQARPRNSRHVGTAENKSPYPGIKIASASELLDFRFEETEIL
jgi:hypothetical protein